MRDKRRNVHRPLFSLLAGILAAALLVGCGSSSAGQENSISAADDTAGSATASAEEKVPVDSKAPEAVSDTMSENAAEQSETEAGEDIDADVSDKTAGTGTLVVYFSRTGEQYVVGNIDKGNTAIVAEMIAEETGADLFEVLPEEDYYPYTYEELTDVAKQEQNENARPAYQSDVPDLSQYSTVFIGAPVWWGDWPMIMYTFFENEDLSGKTLIPFSTHEGSGLSGFDRKLSEACPDAEIAEGLAIRGDDAQNNQENVRAAVKEWVLSLGY